jgi:hypothetical protein
LHCSIGNDVQARASSALVVGLAVAACGSEPDTLVKTPSAERTPAAPELHARERPGTLVRLVELPAPGPYHLTALPDGQLAASRSQRTLLIDRSGALIRELPFGGLIASDAEGNLVVAGEFSGSIELFGAQYESAGGLDAFVVKLDAEWAPRWVRQLGGAEQERPRGLAIQGADVIVMGSGMGTRKLDRDGNQLWSTALAGTDLAVASDGTLFLAGGFVDDLQIGADAHYADQPSVFIAKLGPDGDPLWSRSFKATSVAEASRVGTDSDGNLALVGSFRGHLSLGGETLVHESASGQPYTAGFFAKYDRNGAHICSRPSEIANHFELVADSAGNFALTGNVSDQQPLLELRVVDPNGRELWRKSGPTEIELGTGYGFEIALEREQLLHWSVDAHSKSLGGAVLVPHVATLAN